MRESPFETLDSIDQSIMRITLFLKGIDQGNPAIRCVGYSDLAEMPRNNKIRDSI
jgi:hypothetical protein